MTYLAEAQEAVRDFHVAMRDGPVGGLPEIRNAILRARLIAEEAAETIAALGFTVHMDVYASGQEFDPDPAHMIASESHIGHPDLVEVADGIADTIYVLLGTAVEAGIDMEPIFAEVHRSNMEKMTGPKRDDGKQMKPEGWEPPQIARLIKEQIEEAW